MLNEFLEPDYVYVTTHDCYRQDNETHEVIAVHEIEDHAITAMNKLAIQIINEDYKDKIEYETFYGSDLFRVRENDISCMVTQEDVLKITKMKYYGESTGRD